MYNNYIFIVVMYSLTGYVHKYFLGYNKFRQKGGNHMNTIITIGRQFGSGGHEIGEKLAQHYGIKCYDKELLSRAAKESGFCEEMLQNHDERPTNSFLYNLVMDTYTFGYNSSSFVDMPISHKVFMAQFDAIKKIVVTVNETRYYIEEMETFTCHCFRHTFATRCFEAGIQPKTVQKYLGHATLQMTMDLYTSVMPKHLSNEIDKLDNELEKISESGEEIIDSRYKQEKKNGIIAFPGDSLVV